MSGGKSFSMEHGRHLNRKAATQYHEKTNGNVRTKQIINHLLPMSSVTSSEAISLLINLHKMN